MPYPNRALLTTPLEFIVKESGIPDAGLGVWAVTDIPECVIIGPYDGEVIYEHDPEEWHPYAWAVCAFKR